MELKTDKNTKFILTITIEKKSLKFNLTESKDKPDSILIKEYESSIPLKKLKEKKFFQKCKNINEAHKKLTELINNSLNIKMLRDKEKYLNLSIQRPLKKKSLDFKISKKKIPLSKTFQTNTTNIDLNKNPPSSFQTIKEEEEEEEIKDPIEAIKKLREKNKLFLKLIEELKQNNEMLNKRLEIVEKKCHIKKKKKDKEEKEEEEEEEEEDEEDEDEDEEEEDEEEEEEEEEEDVEEEEEEEEDDDDDDDEDEDEEDDKKEEKKDDKKEEKKDDKKEKKDGKKKVKKNDKKKEKKQVKKVPKSKTMEMSNLVNKKQKK